jgi:hypothetical protein
MPRIGKCWRNSRDVSSARLKLPGRPRLVVMDLAKRIKVIGIGMSGFKWMFLTSLYLYVIGGEEVEDGGYYRPVPTEDESEDPKMKAASEVLDKAMLKIDD